MVAKNKRTIYNYLKVNFLTSLVLLLKEKFTKITLKIIKAAYSKMALNLTICRNIKMGVRTDNFRISASRLSAPNFRPPKYKIQLHKNENTIM